MGFIDETNSKQFGVEWRRTSVRLYDDYMEDENETTKQIFSDHRSVEFGAAQLLRIVRFLSQPDKIEMLEERARQEIEECPGVKE